MRQIMPFVARGIVLLGFSTSPAVTPMSSVPPKLNMTTTSAMSRPSQWPSAARDMAPCGKKPPSTVNQFANEARTPESVGRFATITHSPPAIMAMTATILMSANQNSNSPNSLTPNKLSSVMSTRKNAADAHCGMFGNQ